MRKGELKKEILPLTLLEDGATLIRLFKWDCDPEVSILSKDSDLLSSTTAVACL